MKSKIHTCTINPLLSNIPLTQKWVAYYSKQKNMGHYFTLISTHVVAERESFYIETQLRERLLSIGWGDINPINKSLPEIKKIIEAFYPDLCGTVNPDNGAKSLTLFANFKPGDIVFVRGNAQIIDISIITGKPYFDSVGHYPDDYFLKVPFNPLFARKNTVIRTADIPSDIYDEVLYDGGRYLAVRELSEITAKLLLKSMAKNFD